MKKFKNPIAYLIILSVLISLSFVIYHTIKTTALKIPLKEIDKHLAYQKENGIECLEEYKQLLELYPNSFEANYFLAKFYSNNQSKISSIDSNDVEQLLLKSWEINSNFFDSNFMLAQIYFGNKDIDRATKFAKKAEIINNSYKPLVDLIIKIDETVRMIEHFIEIYKINVEKSLNTSNELVDYYYLNTPYFSDVLKDLEFLTPRVKTVNIDGNIIVLSDVKKDFELALINIESKKKAELDCSMSEQKKYLIKILENIKINDLFLMTQLGECSYAWYLDFYNIRGEQAFHKIITGINKNKEITILSTDTVFY